MEINQTALNEAFKPEKGAKVKKEDKLKNPAESKLWIVFLVVGIVCLLGGIGTLIGALMVKPAEVEAIDFPAVPSVAEDNPIFSNLTGEPLADAALVNAPAFCMQVPNGMDGARPQAGLDQAGVIFEAIAEAGITRFAAIFQNPTAAVIGPIRSLRMYYLEWDTPFDCIITHAGGAPDALVAVRNHKNHDENLSTMFRGTASARRWNNLFTTSAMLSSFASKYPESKIDGFNRMTPTESNTARVANLTTTDFDITKAASGNTSAINVEVPSIKIRFGGIASYNVNYTYDVDSNKYLRSYANGDAHMIYHCPDGDLGSVNPESACELVQLAPSVVIAMVVQQRKASDNYHEDITTTGFGDAYIFQNGTAIRGTWKKPTAKDQIRFIDADGQEIELAPGQTFISAIPAYGGVEY